MIESLTNAVKSVIGEVVKSSSSELVWNLPSRQWSVFQVAKSPRRVFLRRRTLNLQSRYVPEECHKRRARAWRIAGWCDRKVQKFAWKYRRYNPGSDRWRQHRSRSRSMWYTTGSYVMNSSPSWQYLTIAHAETSHESGGGIKPGCRYASVTAGKMANTALQ